MYLIINRSDIYYMTGVRPDMVGEILLIIQVQNTTRLPPPGMTKSGRVGQEYKIQNKRIVLCDPRTAGLFDAKKCIIIAERKQWGKIFKKYTTLATDPDVLTQTLRATLETFGVEFVMQESPITKLRQIKTSEEITLLKKSQQLNFQVYNRILPHLVPGVTEEEIARKICVLQLELGATGASFPPIVAFGENSAIPHHVPTNRKLQKGDGILIDMGLVYKGYCSDMTRCLKLEKREKRREKRKQTFEEIYQLLQKITHEIIQSIKPGVRVAALDKKVRKMLGKNATYFTHSLGHGVGIDVHESPRVALKSKEILQAGMVITIEPGLYFPGKFGARHEEMILVTEKGAEVF